MDISEPDQTVSSVPVPSSFCSSVMVTKPGESSKESRIGILVPNFQKSPSYVCAPSGSLSDFGVSPQQRNWFSGSVILRPILGPNQGSQFSLYRTLTYAPFPTGTSLSSLGRPWQIEQLMYSRNPSTFQNMDIHLWPPPPIFPGHGSEIDTKEVPIDPVGKGLKDMDKNRKGEKNVDQLGIESLNNFSVGVPPLLTSKLTNMDNIRGSKTPNKDNDNQDDSSNGGSFLDEGCEIFDEDLEPLDLKIRPQLKSPLSQQEVQSPLSSIRQSKDDSASNNPTCSNISKENVLFDKSNAEKVSPCFVKSISMSPLQKHDREATSKIKNTKVYPHPFDSVDRDLSLPIKKQRMMAAPRTNSQQNKTARVMVRICPKCKCDFRSTTFGKCPLCNANAVVKNPSFVLNSSLTCLSSLPPQLAFSRNNDRIGVVANVELQLGTILGPLVGRVTDIKEAHTLTNPQNVWVAEVATSGISHLISTENETESNWLRYVLHGDKDYNTAVVIRRAKIFFVTTEVIYSGDELILRPYNPLVAHLNSDQSLVCKECPNTYTSPLYLSNHCALQHPHPARHSIKAAPFPAATQISADVRSTHKHASKRKTGKKRCAPLQNDSKVKNEEDPQLLSLRELGAGMERFDCEACSQTSPNSQDSAQHLETTPNAEVHAGELLRCEHCGKTFKRKQSYRRHVTSHRTKTEKQPSRTCSSCGRQLYSSSNLKVHMLTHSGVKPFLCKMDSCSVGFTTKQSLQLHYIKRHGLNHKTMPPIERTVPFTLEGYCRQSNLDESSNTPLNPCELYTATESELCTAEKTQSETTTTCEESTGQQSKRVEDLQSPTGIVNSDQATAGGGAGPASSEQSNCLDSSRDILPSSLDTNEKLEADSETQRYMEAE